MKILIAEDEIGIRENYKIILESRNHQVTLAQDGEECISEFDRAFSKLQAENPLIVEKSPFDLVVLDFRMPKKDGVDVANYILSICPRQKLIIATAYTLDALDGLMAKVGQGIEVLQKPFDLDAFAAMVEDFGSKTLPV